MKIIKTVPAWAVVFNFLPPHILPFPLQLIPAVHLSVPAQRWLLFSKGVSLSASFSSSLDVVVALGNGADTPIFFADGYVGASRRVPKLLINVFMVL